MSGVSFKRIKTVTSDISAVSKPLCDGCGLDPSLDLSLPEGLWRTLQRAASTLVSTSGMLQMPTGVSAQRAEACGTTVSVRPSGRVTFDGVIYREGAAPQRSGLKSAFVLLLLASLAIPARAADTPGAWVKIFPSLAAVPHTCAKLDQHFALCGSAQGRPTVSLAAGRIAIENNLDVEMQRYNLLAAEKDLLRAQGGGVTRGLQYAITEVPLGIGGPASPLLTSLGQQSSGGNAIPTNPSELGVLSGTQSNLSILGQNSLSPGTTLPIYDPSLMGELNYSHQSTPEISPASYGTDNLIQTTMNANVGLTRASRPEPRLICRLTTRATQLNSTTVNYTPYVTSSLSLTLTQPLLRGFGRSMNRRYIRIAANRRRSPPCCFKSNSSDGLRCCAPVFDLTSSCRQRCGEGSGPAVGRVAQTRGRLSR